MTVQGMRTQLLLWFHCGPGLDVLLDSDHVHVLKKLRTQGMTSLMAELIEVVQKLPGCMVYGMNTIYPKMLKTHEVVVVVTPLQCYMENQDKACGAADPGGGSQFQKEGTRLPQIYLECCFCHGSWNSGPDWLFRDAMDVMEVRQSYVCGSGEGL